MPKAMKKQTGVRRPKKLLIQMKEGMKITGPKKPCYQYVRQYLGGYRLQCVANRACLVTMAEEWRNVTNDFAKTYGGTRREVYEGRRAFVAKAGETKGDLKKSNKGTIVSNKRSASPWNKAVKADFGPLPKTDPVSIIAKQLMPFMENDA